MSRILAIESSHDACSVALWIDGQLNEILEQAPRSHAQRILPMVHELLAAAQLSLPQLDAIAYSRGPGSFTGLRIAAGVTQGLAFGADLPVISVSTLQTMAAAFNPPQPSYCAVAVDARMNEVYFACYVVSGAELIELETEQILAVEQLSLPECHQLVNPLSDTAVVSPLPDERWQCIGSGWPLLPQARRPWLTDSNKSVFYDEALNQPRAEYVARLASKLWSEGKVLAAEDAQPVYLRGTGAWKKRQQQ